MAVVRWRPPRGVNEERSDRVQVGAARWLIEPTNAGLVVAEPGTRRAVPKRRPPTVDGTTTRTDAFVASARHPR